MSDKHFKIGIVVMFVTVTVVIPISEGITDPLVIAVSGIIGVLIYPFIILLCEILWYLENL